MPLKPMGTSITQSALSRWTQYCYLIDNRWWLLCNHRQYFHHSFLFLQLLNWIEIVFFEIIGSRLRRLRAAHHIFAYHSYKQHMMQAIGCFIHVWYSLLLGIVRIKRPLGLPSLFITIKIISPTSQKLSGGVSVSLITSSHCIFSLHCFIISMHFFIASSFISSIYDHHSSSYKLEEDL